MLSPGGRLAIANPDPDGFREMWLMEWFPELLGGELARFPDSVDFAEELAAAGFQPAEVERVAVPRRFDRNEALEKIRGQHISSFDLLTDGEYRAGLERAEQGLPDRVEYVLRSLLVVAVRPAL